MSQLPTPEFLQGVERLLGGRIVSVEPLGGQAFAVSWADGRRTVLKGVPRQEAEFWHPGKPWTELVAADLMTAEDAPTPRLLAADLTHGWLLREFAPGRPLDEVADPKGHRGRADEGGVSPVFSALVAELSRLEATFEAVWPELAPFDATPAGDLAALAVGVGRLLPDNAQSAWDDLTRLAESGPRLPGPLDVRPANAVWNGDTVFFLDLATVGFDYKERRLVAYAQAAGRTWSSLLCESAYSAYARVNGEDAAVRLAYFDLMFWALVFARLRILEHRAASPAGQVLRNVWGDPATLRPKWLTQWRRPRIHDPRIDAVVRALTGSSAGQPAR